MSYFRTSLYLLMGWLTICGISGWWWIIPRFWASISVVIGILSGLVLVGMIRSSHNSEEKKE